MKTILKICFVLMMLCSLADAQSLGFNAKPYVPWSDITLGQVKMNDTVSDQATMDAIIADTRVKEIFFPSRGVVRVNLNINRSNLTIHLGDSCIIDGVFHVAVGSNADNIVENITVLGRVFCTQRVGTFFCNNISIPDGITIVPTFSGYRNQSQAVNGGTRGVHFYEGTKNLTCGAIYVPDNDGAIYAVGIDISSNDSIRYQPENIDILSITVGMDNDSSALRMASTRNVHIGRVNVYGWKNRNAIHIYNCNDTRIDEWHVEDSNRYSKSGLSAFYTELDTNGQYGIGTVAADTSTIIGVSVVSSTGKTVFRDLTLLSLDTVGAKYALDIESSRMVFVDRLYARKWFQGVRQVNSKMVYLGVWYVDSCRTAYATGGTTDTLMTLKWWFKDNTVSNEPPSLISTLYGPLVPDVVDTSFTGLKIYGTGSQGDLGGDSIPASQIVAGGNLRLIVSNATAERGSLLGFGFLQSGTERICAGFHAQNFTSAGLGQQQVSFVTRKNQNDTTLTQVFMISSGGDIWIGRDTSVGWKMPNTRASATGQTIKSTGGANTAWANDSVGTGGSGVTPGVDSTIASGGTDAYGSGFIRVKDSNLVLGVSSNGDTAYIRLSYFVHLLDSFAVGNNITVTGSGEIRAINIIAQSMTSNSALTLAFLDSLIMTHNGRNIMNIYGTVDTLGDSTTHLTIGENTRFLIHVDGITADTMAALEFNLDTCDGSGNCGRAYQFSPRNLGSDGDILYRDGDSTYWGAPPAGGSGAVVKVDTVNAGGGNIAYTDSVILKENYGIGWRTNTSQALDTLQPVLDTTTVLSTKANVLARAGDTAAVLRTFVRDSSHHIRIDTVGNGTGGYVPKHNFVIRQNAEASLDFQIYPSAASDTLSFKVASAGIATGHIANNAVTETKTDSTNRRYAFSTLAPDSIALKASMRVERTDSAFIVNCDSFFFRNEAADTFFTAKDSSAHTLIRPGDNTAFIATTNIFKIAGGTADSALATLGSVKALIGDSTADIDSNNIVDVGVSIPEDVAPLTSAEWFAKLSTKTGSGGSAVFATSPTIDAPTVTTSFTGNVLDSANIKANSLDSQDVKNDAIRGSGREILEASIDSTDLANNSVGATEIAVGEVGNSELASTAVDSTKIPATSVAISDINLNGRKHNVDLNIVHTGHFAGDLDSALTTDQSWILTTPGTNGDAGTLTGLYLLACSTSTAQDSLRFFLSGMVDEDALIESLVVIYKTSNATDIQFDSLRLLGDSVSASLSTVGATPDTLLKTTTDLQNTSDTRAAFELTQTSGKIYRGGMLTLWILLTSDASTGANESARIRRAWVVTRLRN